MSQLIFLCIDFESDGQHCIFSGGLAVAFYGNAKLQTGVDNFVYAVKTTNKTIRTSLQLVSLIQ